MINRHIVSKITTENRSYLRAETRDPKSHKPAKFDGLHDDSRPSSPCFREFMVPVLFMLNKRAKHREEFPSQAMQIRLKSPPDVRNFSNQTGTCWRAFFYLRFFTRSIFSRPVTLTPSDSNYVGINLTAFSIFARFVHGSGIIDEGLYRASPPPPLRRIK